MTMEKPTTFKSVKTVFTFIKNLVSDAQNQFEKPEATFVKKQRLQPLFLKAIQNRKTFLGLLLFLCFSGANAQVGTAFSQRLPGGSVKVKGDIILIGNTTINKVKNRPYKGNKPPSDYVENPADFSTPLQDGVKYTGTVTNLSALTTEANLDFNGTGNNNDFYVEYSDIDNDNSTFNSTSANLAINNSCKSIVFAGLYWSAIYPYERSTDVGQKYAGSLRESDWNKVKFKVPNGSYVELEASKTDTKEVIFDGYKKNGSNVSDSFKDSPYVCFKDVTSLLQNVKNAAGQLDADGTYTVANIRAARGKRNGGGAGGWTLVVIYESPSLPSKYISVFDGYVGVDPGSTANKSVPFTVSGFQTLPVGFPVTAKIGVGALEGDNQITGDDFQIKANTVAGYTKITDAINLEGNFFNASISNNGVSVQNRVPKSTNTMGIDIDNVLIQNDENKIIPNNETGATLLLTTDGDGFGAYVTTFAVDIIEPKIILTKVAKGVRIENGAEVEYNLDGLPVTLGQEIRYVIGFRNQGNDNAKSFTITDVLPQNVIFNPDTDRLIEPAGVKFVSYDRATRTIVYEIADYLVIKQGPTTALEIRVRVVNDCNELIDACSNVIKNTAISRYFGDKSPTNNGQPYGDGSYSFDTGCIVGDPSSTNFLVGIDQCLFNREVFLCGSAQLKAANGYTTYEWKDPNGVVFGGNNQIVTVTKAGKYTVQTGGNPDCKGILQNFDVKDQVAGANVNPISEYANNIDPVTNRPYTCTRDNIEFPKIFLCGKNDTRILDTKITQAISIVWQETTDVPPTGFPSSCPYDTAPNWTNVGTPGRTFTANRPGAFRVVITYGNNCVNTFYFSVFQNPLEPKAEVQNIVCDTKGSITVTTPPINSDYTYSLDNVNGTYQASNVFNNVSQGAHTVYIKQNPAAGETSFCPFHVDVMVAKEVFSGRVEKTDPLCSPGLGSMSIFAEGLTKGDYQFIVKKAGTNTIVADSGLLTTPNYIIFDQKFAPGLYDVEILSPKNGCKIVKEDIEILDKVLKATANVTKTLACGDGEITVKASGGTPIPGATPSYYYSLNGVNLGQLTDPVIIPIKRPLPTGGEYKIVVTDNNSCKVTLPTITVVDIQKPTVKINQKNVTCYNSKEGEISMEVTPTNSGYGVSYSVNNGAYTTLPTTGLNPGEYSVIVKYTYGTEECLDEARKITITGPTSPLTASGGVAELSGCGPAGNTDQGLVRITNAQGGVQFPAPTPYRYSFDGKQTWITSNQAYVNPSATPYTLYIKDAAGCIFEVTGIVLEKKPTDPVFTVSTPVYTCDGKGTVNVTVQTDPNVNYAYKYYLGKFNGTTYVYTENTNTPPSTFKDIPVGDYKIKVEYDLITAATYSNLLKEDFGSGPPTTTPGIAAAYCFNDQREFAPYQCKFPDGTPSRSVEDNAYSVTSFFWRGDDLLSNNTGAWFHFKDHTTNPNNLANTGDANGRYLLVNIGSAAGPNGILYSKPIHDVIPNQPIEVNIAVANLLRAGIAGDSPSVLFELVDPSGKVVASHLGGVIAASTTDPNREKWVTPPTISLNPGPNTDLTFVIRSGSILYGGNDIVIDDISVRQIPKSCLADKILDLKVEDKKAFTAKVDNINGVKCKGDTNGSFNIVVENFDTNNGFFYTLNGSANPVVWQNSKVSPVPVTNRGEGTYDIRVRYANNATSCNFTIKPEITAPDVFVVDASASTATCKVGATVTATAVGGTPAYTLTIKDKNSAFTKTFPTDGILKDIPPGTYTVSGIDANGCSDARNTDLVIATPEKPEAEVVKDAGLCFASNAKITVNVTKGVGPYTYQVSIDGGTYSDPSATFNGPSFTYTATAPGKYDFLITDSNNCEAVAVSQKIDKSITAKADVTVPLTCKSGNAANATIEVTIDGGTGPYTYTVTNKATNAVLVNNGTTPGPKFTYSAATAATYVFTIKDANGCSFPVEKTVNTKAEPTATYKVENVTCFDAKNGYIDITAGSGTAPFTYRFNGTGAFTTTTHYDNLPGSVAGIEYSFIVKDATECTKEYKFKVFQPADITASASITTPYTCETKATITASASGGNGGFTYVLKNGTTTVATNTDGIFPNLIAAGTYTVEITDSKGCPKTVSAGTIVALNSPAGMTLTPGAVTCPSNTASVTITNVVNAAGVAVPTAGLEYRIKSPTPPGTTTYQTNNQFNGLAAGVTYTFEVRDAKKCVYEKELEIKALPVFAVTVKSKISIACLGSTDGSAIFTVSGMGNNVAYSYKVDALAAVTGTSPATGTTFDISVPNLGTGTHNIVVTNTATTCSDSEQVTIAAPTAVLKLNVTDVTHVTCDKKGTATINAVGGWGSFTYTVKPATGAAIVQTTKLFENLEAGDYTFTVEDLRGCKVDGTFTINDKVYPVASIDATTDLCAGSTGGATIKVTPNAKTNYVYSINGGTTTQNNGTFTGLIPGDYIVTVKDLSTGCSIDLPKQIIAKPVVVAEHKITKILDCSPSSAATIEVTIADGYPDYRYRVNINGAGFPAAYTAIGAGVKTFTYPASVAGSYVFEILDSKGCITGFPETIAPKVTPDFTTTVEHVKCFGEATGKITVKATPISGTYEYSKDNGSNWQPSNEFTGLIKGSYTIVVRDTNTKCFISKSVPVNGPNVILSASANVTVKLSCTTNNVAQAATITVTAGGGTPFTGTDKYRYTYTQGAIVVGPITSNTFSTDKSGLVSVVVTDANGCTVPTSVTIAPLDAPTAVAFSAPAITCDAAKLRTNLKVDVTGGVFPLKYEITSHTAAAAPTGALVATGINSNTYTFTGLLPGTYYVKVTDANGCIKTGDYPIANVDPIQESGSITKNVSCKDLADGKLEFTISGNTNGTNGYTYSLTGVVSGLISTGISKVGDVITYSGLKGDSYTFTVTNTLTTCKDSETIVLDNPTAVTIVSASGPKVFCSRNNSVITVTATGGTGTLYYAVVKSASAAPTYPAGYSTDNKFDKNTVADGLDYDVYVRDANGCPATTTVHITRDVLPTVNPIATTCYTGGNINITMSGTVFAGSGILYGVDGNYSSNATKTISGPGTYKLTVKDDNGCISAAFDLVITNLLTLKLTPVKDLTCTVVPPFTKIDAKVTLTAGGGNSTYTYEYKLGTGGTYAPIVPTGNVFETTAPGSYYFRVSSAGCSVESTVPFVVTTPIAPTPTAVATGTLCTTSAEGTIKISVTGGTPPFTYTIDNWVTSNDTGYFSGLTGAVGAGKGYTYQVRDAKGCVRSGTAQAFVVAPDPVAFETEQENIECDKTGGTGSNLGSITVKNVTGGTGSYVYHISNNFGYSDSFNAPTGLPHKFDIIDFGIYTVEVRDANSCPASKEITMASPPEDLDIDIDATANCLTGGTAVVTVKVIIPSADYEFGILEFNTSPYSLNFSGPDVVGGKVKTFSNLIPGVTYTFVVHDKATNCYFLKPASAPIPAASLLEGPATPTNVTCSGANNGSVSFTVSKWLATTTDVEYQIFRAQDNFPIMAAPVKVNVAGSTTPFTRTYPAALPGTLAPGRYYIVYTEYNGVVKGCQASSGTFEIKQSSTPLKVVASSLKNDNCKPNAGIVTSQASGGTGPYLYQIVTDNGAIGFGAGDTKPLETSFLSTYTSNTFNVNSGNYLVWAKDAYGCIESAPVQIALDPSPVFALSIDNKCAKEGEFSVTVSQVTAGIPPYYIKVNSGSYEPITTPLPYKITGLYSGPIDVTVRDANGCETPLMQAPITPTPTATAAVTKVLNCSPGTTIVNATITVKIEKGTLPYAKYEVKKGSTAYAVITPTTTVAAGLTTFTYSVAAADAAVYKFRITDANGCPIETNEVTVDPIKPIIVSSIDVQPKCFGGTGSVELVASGGQGPYTYSFKNSAFTSTTIYPATAGAYTYVVRDALGCEQSGTGTLLQPSALALVAPIITPLQCGTGNVAQSATVVLGATGGTKDYLYSFKNSAFTTKTTYTVDDTKNDQTIGYTIQDANGCSVSGSVTILKLSPPTNFKMTQGAVITCTTLNTSVTISDVENGVGAVTYQMISPNLIDNLNNPVFSGLLPDVDYVFQVTDANKCTVQKPFRIANVINIKAVEQSTTGITCSTATDGKASFLVSGFAGTYRYVLDGVAFNGPFTSTTINLTGLAKGPHTIQIFDIATNCATPVIPFNIASPASALILATPVVTPLGCTTSGAVTLTASGGWGNYTYTLTQPNGSLLTNNDGVFINLTQTGPYTVSVKDSNSCTVAVAAAFTLVTAPLPVATIAATSDYCYNNTNSTTLVVTATKAVPYPVTFEYSINNGQSWQPTNTFPNLTPGDYSVMVRDNFGCVSTAVSTTINGRLFASAENKKDIYCTGVLNGRIRVSALGGYPDYSYTYQIGAGPVSAKIPFAPGATFVDYSVNAAAPGTYTFVVYDSKGCSYPIPAVIMTAPTPVVYTADPTSPYCSPSQGNVNNGSILFTLAPSNNNPDYMYSIQRTIPAGGALITQDTPLFTNLSAGTYAVNVTSGRNCGAPTTVVIDSPSLVVATASASPFACSSPANTVNATVVTVTGAGGAGTGAIGDYTYSANGTVWETTNTFNVIDNGAAQNLTYYVKDVNGCIDDVQISINAFPRLISAKPSLVTKAACNNAGEVIRVTIAGGSVPYDFEYQVSVDGAAYSTPAIPVTAGTNTFDYTATVPGHLYQFKVTDKTTGCFIISDAYKVPLFNIAEVVATASSMVKCFGSNEGKIAINITDYKGPYTYQILNGGVAIPGASGTGNSNTVNPFTIPFDLVEGKVYTVSITETSYPFCTVVSDNVIITQPPVLDLSALVITNVNQNCKTTGAVLTIDKTTIVGGTPDYTYAFVPAGTTPAAGDYQPENTKTIATTRIAPAFDAWDVYVKDANGCFQHVTVNISLDPMPAITNVTVASQCYSAAGYRIDVAATGVAPLQYSLDGVQFQDDNFFIVSSPGDYTVTVRDKNKCEVKATAPVTILEPLTLIAEVTKTPTCTAADGTVTLTAGGGTVAPVSYVYTRDNWVTTSVSPVFNGLAPGTYIFKVRDTATTPSCEKEVSVKIDNPTLVTGIVATPSPVSCNGGTDGSIAVTLTGTNDNPIYMYSLSGPVNRVAQESPIFNDLPFGTYTVTVTSGKGCSNTATAVVAQPNPIAVGTPTVTQYLCNAGTNTPLSASITVVPGSVTGGSQDYIIYEFIRDGKTVQKDDRNTYTEVDNLGGSYVVKVFDTNNCEGSSTAVIINPYVGIADLDLDVTPINCRDGESVQVTAIATSGTLPTLTYTIEGISPTVYPITSSPTGLFTGLQIGSYKIIVTNTVTGCSVERFHTVNNPNTFDIVATDAVNITCFNAANGSITLTLVDEIIPADNAGIFDYVITDQLGNVRSGRSTSVELKLANLTAGKYNVVANLVGVPYCEVKTEFTIEGPAAALEIELSKKEITCLTGNKDGEIVTTATGGWTGDYQYKLDGPVTVPYGSENHFTNLTAGTYTVTVKDVSGCEVSGPVVLSNPTPITATIATDKTLLACYNNQDATITVTNVAGGSANYKYTLHGVLADGTVITRDAQLDKVFTDLGAGTYYVTVSDDWTCSGDSNKITIGQPDVMKVLLALERSETCQITPVLRLTASGGTGPYFYSVDGITYNPVSFASFVDIQLPQTTVDLDYQYYVKDSNNCASVLSGKVPMSPVPALEFEKLESIDVPCKGGATGSIYAAAKGGFGNYVYVLLNAAKVPFTPTPTQLTPGTFSNLPVGTYYVEVTSGDCQKISDLIEITEPALSLTAVVTPFNVTCAGFNNGRITIVASGGGDGEYTYAITPEIEQFFDVPLFENLKPGPYTVRVQKGQCYVDYPVVIEDAIPLVAQEITASQVPELCFGDKDGAAYVEVDGGKGPYTASIVGNGVTVDFRAPDIDANTFSFLGLSGGVEYVVTVKDANECTQEVYIKLPEPVKVIPTIVENYTCENDLPVNSITVSLEGNIDVANYPEVVYTLFLDGVSTGISQKGNPVFRNLPSGNYSVEVTFAGCTKPSNTITIVAVQPLVAVDATLESKEINTIVVKASGGVKPYEYSFNGEAFTSSNSYQIYKTDVYKVIVRDKNGCQVYLDVPGEYVNICMPNYFTPGGEYPEIGPGCGALAYKDLTFKIFDRYGRAVATYRVGQKWDGKYNGEELPTGDYWYVLKLNDEKDAREFVGHFTLYR